MPSPHLAAKGSRRWLQIAVNQRPETLNQPLRAALRLPEQTTVEWLSPLAEENFIEYRDSAVISRLGINLRHSLFDFWPPGGPMWDGLARTSTGKFILLEAKAHIQEMVSPPSRASEKSRAQIEQSLRTVQKALAPRGRVDWSGTFYQYANRLAHLYFLRELNAVPAHLVFLFFVNAADVRGPSERAEWEGAIKLVEGYLGLGRHRMAKYVHKIFLDVAPLSTTVASDAPPMD